MKGKIEKKEKVFLESYNTYHQDIFRFCMFKLRNRANALDITQETFMKFWEYIVNDSLDERNNERALLYRIANNLIIDYFKKKKSIFIEDMSVFEQDGQLKHSTFETLSNRIDGEKLIYLLHKLPHKTRDVLILRFIQDLSIEEIADILKIKKNTVSVQIHRALEKFKKLIQEEYGI